ncbi:MAG: hypothetical protein J7L69_07975, partial [Desulfobulbaceae bacterium]|nr:hypothetical protein [Desulfobulbaceae bacterium]
TGYRQLDSRSDELVTSQSDVTKNNPEKQGRPNSKTNSLQPKPYQISIEASAGNGYKKIPPDKKNSG